jgi:hypothetical protein
LTPVPSSDGPEPEIEDYSSKASSPPAKGLPSPVSADEGQTNGLDEQNARGTPSRRVLHPRPSCDTRSLTSNRQRRRPSSTPSRIVKAPMETMCSNPSLLPVLGLQSGGDSRIVPMRMFTSRSMRRS